ncbi:MAG: aspartate/glutamate racemase family protein, partial [Blautia sp.]
GYMGPTTPNRRYHTTEGQLMNGFPIGILQLYAHLPFFPGNVSNAYTYDFPVKFLEVKGTGIDNILAGDMSLLDSIIEAARQLELDGCRAVCANCGFFGHYQRLVADALDIPVYLSSMVQVPWALVGMKSGQKLGIMTANSNTLTPSLFEACGISEQMRQRCVVYGAQDEKEFPNILTGNGGLDYDLVGDELSGIARRMIQEHPDVGAVLLECTDMPPYAHRLQAELHMPVYDAITLIRYVKSTVTQMPYYGFL